MKIIHEKYANVKCPLLHNLSDNDICGSRPSFSIPSINTGTHSIIVKKKPSECVWDLKIMILSWVDRCRSRLLYSLVIFHFPSAVGVITHYRHCRHCRHCSSKFRHCRFHCRLCLHRFRHFRRTADSTADIAADGSCFNGP